MNGDLRFLLVVLDGLRADMVRPELTPNLCRLQRHGIRMSNARAAFPTETRVNQSTLITGCWPSRHGMVANVFLEPRLQPDGLFNTGQVDLLATADALAGGRLLQAPDLGGVLHAAGGSLAVLGAGTTGGNRLLHRHAERLGALNMSLHGLAACTTPAAAEQVIAAIGPIPEAALPNAGRSRWLADAYMHDVAPRLDPSATILWFSDPDSTYHYRGIGSPEARAAIVEVDRQLGRLLDWRAGSGRSDSLQIVVLSDHGHVTTVAPPVQLAARLQAAGLPGEVQVAPGSCGGLYLEAGDDGTELARWLQDQDWCGVLFTAGGDGVEGTLPGCFDARLAGLNHPRTADLVFVLQADMSPGSGGYAGRTRHDNPEIPQGGGLHGGLTLPELHHVLVFSGSRFGRGIDCTAPAGLVDVMPTLLHLMEIAPPGRMHGRVLYEALAEAPVPAARPTPRQARVGFADGSTGILAWLEHAGRRYLNGAGRD